MGNNASSSFQYPKAVHEISEYKKIPFEVANTYYNRFMSVMNCRDDDKKNNKVKIRVEKEQFRKFFPFISKVCFENMCSHIKSENNYISFSNFVDLSLCVSPNSYNSHLEELLYSIFETKNGFCYDLFLDELKVNMIVKSQEELDSLYKLFESGKENPNGFISHDEFIKISKEKNYLILEKAKSLIFSSSLFQ